MSISNLYVITCCLMLSYVLLFYCFIVLHFIILQTSERIIDRSVGEVRRWFVSNAPIGYVSYAYPKEMQQQRKQYGAKVYFYRAQLIEGNLKLETRLYTDMAWISRDEVGEYFNEDMAEYLTELLPLI